MLTHCRQADASASTPSYDVDCESEASARWTTQSLNTEMMTANWSSQSEAKIVEASSLLDPHLYGQNRAENNESPQNASRSITTDDLKANEQQDCLQEENGENKPEYKEVEGGIPKEESSLVPSHNHDQTAGEPQNVQIKDDITLHAGDRDENTGPDPGASGDELDPAAAVPPSPSPSLESIGSSHKFVWNRLVYPFGNSQNLFEIALAPSGDWWARLNADGTLILGSLVGSVQRIERQLQLENLPGVVCSMAINCDAQVLALGDSLGRAIEYETVSGRRLRTFDACAGGGRMTCLAYSRLLRKNRSSLGWVGELNSSQVEFGMIYKIFKKGHEGNSRWRPENGKKILSISFPREGLMVALGYGDGTVTIHNTSSMELVQNYDVQTGLSCLAHFPDEIGEPIFAYSWNTRVFVRHPTSQYTALNKVLSSLVVGLALQKHENTGQFSIIAVTVDGQIWYKEPEIAITSNQISMRGPDSLVDRARDEPPLRLSIEDKTKSTSSEELSPEVAAEYDNDEVENSPSPQKSSEARSTDWPIGATRRNDPPTTKADDDHTPAGRNGPPSNEPDRDNSRTQNKIGSTNARRLSILTAFRKRGGK